MSILLLDNEENTASNILERNGLLDEQDTTSGPLVDELKKSIQETTADMPLGKALHLLLNVHGQVFDKAVSSILKSSTAAEIAIKTAECRYALDKMEVRIFIQNMTTSSHHQGHFIHPELHIKGRFSIVQSNIRFAQRQVSQKAA